MSEFAAIVIGGGMSGISACIKLIESGVLNILLLEASDRLGGRINTVPFRKILSRCSHLIDYKRFIYVKKIVLLRWVRSGSMVKREIPFTRLQIG